MITSKFFTKVPIKYLKKCPELMGCLSGDWVRSAEDSLWMGFFEDNNLIGLMNYEYDNAKFFNGLPLWTMFIDKFEVCKKCTGKGYGPMIVAWIEQNMPVHEILLCHRSFDDDNGRSYKFWRKMGFRKECARHQVMKKVIVRGKCL